MQDRAPLNPGRVLVTPEDGSTPFHATITRADNPTQTGDPLNKSTLLKDETAALYGLDSDAVPDDVLQQIKPELDKAAETVLDTSTGKKVSVSGGIPLFGFNSFSILMLSNNTNGDKESESGASLPCAVYNDDTKELYVAYYGTKTLSSSTYYSGYIGKISGDANGNIHPETVYYTGQNTTSDTNPHLSYIRTFDVDNALVVMLYKSKVIAYDPKFSNSAVFSYSFMNGVFVTDNYIGGIRSDSYSARYLLYKKRDSTGALTSITLSAGPSSNPALLIVGVYADTVYFYSNTSNTTMDFYKFDCSTGALSKITTATFKTQTDIAPCMFHDEFAYMFCGDMSDNYYLHSKVLRMNLATGELENIDEVVASPTLTTRSTSQGYGGYLGTIDNTPYFLNGTNNHLISFDKDTCDISYSPILNTIPESSDAIYLSYLRERNAKSSELGGIVSVAQALLDVKNSEWISQVHCQRYVNGSNTGALTYYPYQTNNTHSTRRRLSIVHIGKTMQSIDAMGIYPDAKTVSNGRIRQIIGGSVRRLSDVVDYE